MNRYRPPGKKREDFLVWLGRFVPEKGPHVAIEVARQAQVPLMLAGTIDRYVKASVSSFMIRLNRRSIMTRLRRLGL